MYEQLRIGQSRPVSRLRAGLFALTIFFTPLAFGQVEPSPEPPGPLGDVEIPMDPRLFDSNPNVGFIKDRAAAVRLGKAYFWDQNVGTDGQACASCHFNAFADDRVKNQLAPGGPNAAQVFKSPHGVNQTLTAASFPRAVGNDGSAVGSPSVTSSAGVAPTTFLGLIPISGGRLGDDIVAVSPADPLFIKNGLMTRRVEPRNTPTVVNAVFNFRNFWDGRANNVFNGVDVFGRRGNQANPGQGVYVNDSTKQQFEIIHASLASQAVGPPLSIKEMAAEGRPFADICKKLFTRIPLETQKVHKQDTHLGALARTNIRSWYKGLDTTWEAMIDEAFHPRFVGNHVTEVEPGYTQAEANCAFIFGMSVMVYEMELVSDDAPFDRFAGGNKWAITWRQKKGLDIFLNKGKCINCHNGPEFTKAATQLVDEDEEEGLVERMLMGDQNRGPALYDNGFYNIGVRPTDEDIAVGDVDPFGNPLSFTDQYIEMLLGNDPPDPFEIDECKFEIRFDPASAGDLDGDGDDDPFPAGFEFESISCDDGSTTLRPKHPADTADPDLQEETLMALRQAVRGAFKVPGLRNLEWTGPYFHNGGKSTLKQVVNFYNRGGDFPNTNQRNLDPDIQPLGLSGFEKTALVDFMLTLGDQRVRKSQGVFDHPELRVTVGHLEQDRGDGVMRDLKRLIPAVGNGKLTNGQNAPVANRFLGLSPFDN